LEVANSTMLVAPTHPAAALKRDSGAAIFGATNVSGAADVRESSNSPTLRRR
jgi:hypothetical protein